MNFSDTLDHLLNEDSRFNPAALYNLSRLEPAETERMTSIWPSIPVTRRLELVKELVDITETNFEVDFESVFLWGLHDNDPSVRATCIEGLWESDDLALMNQLFQISQTDSSVQVRAAAVTSLGRFILLSELGKLPAHRCQSVYEMLYALVLDGSEALEIRRRALESVAYVSNDDVVAMIQGAYDHPDEKMRISAVFGMGRSADTRWISIVVGELFSVNPEMRYEAARACGELQARAAVPRLAELIDDPDREVQEATLWALGQAGGDQARELLQRCLEDGDEATRSTAETALEEMDFLYGQFDLPFYIADDVEPEQLS